MDTSTALTTTPVQGTDGGLLMIVSPMEAKKRLQQLQAFVQSVMVKEVDYGVIPGTDKPTLYQPGAQKLAEIYGFSATFEDVETVEDWDKPFFLYRKRCILKARQDGRYIGNGIGSCNSKEDRYAWRWVPEWNLSPHVDKAGLLSREKRGQRGKFTVYRVPNEDIFSIVNTLEKMACKRALIHAVIGATRSAGIFAQDLEDLPPEAYGTAADEEDHPPAQSRTQSVKDRVRDRAKAQRSQGAPAQGGNGQGGNGQGGGDGADSDFINPGKVKYLWHLAYERAETLGYEKEDAEGIVRVVLDAHRIPAHPEALEKGPSTKMIPWRGKVFEQICEAIKTWTPKGPTGEQEATDRPDEELF